MAASSLRRQAEAVRRFNRFYTTRIGVLQEGLLDSPFSLTEVRVLYEIAHRDRPTASGLAKALNLDGGYLSRILQRFTRQRLIARTASKVDARQTHLALTAHGHDTLAPLERLSQQQIGTLLKALAPTDRERVVDAMDTIQRALDPTSAPGDARPRTAADSQPAYTLRTHRPGDMGWIVHRHGAIYTQEYGWTDEFEALVAEIVAHFLRHFDPARERCWMAERHGAIVGSVMLVRKSAAVAKLRLLLVEPSARGLGLGKRLVDECVRFAREAGYRRVTLWTQSNLLAARGIYTDAGFEMIEQAHRPAFGADLVSETWEKRL